MRPSRRPSDDPHPASSYWATHTVTPETYKPHKHPTVYSRSSHTPTSHEAVISLRQSAPIPHSSKVTIYQHINVFVSEETQDLKGIRKHDYHHEGMPQQNDKTEIVAFICR